MALCIPRRSLLVGTTSFVTIAATRTGQWVQATACDCDLFAFRRCGSRNLVFAVLGPSAQIAALNIHTGVRSWLIRDGQTSIRHEARLFFGEVAGPAETSRHAYKAAVVETPAQFVPPGEVLRVWAELRSADGARLRVGNPLFAACLAVNPDLAVTYHASSPDQDRLHFAGPVSESIARAMPTVTGAGAQAYGRRLAAMLLPDVLYLRLDHPTGFSYAGQNGRHPADDVRSLTAALLPGRSAAATSRSVPLQDQFPYFLPRSSMS